jgi:hypothetical protein
MTDEVLAALTLAVRACDPAADLPWLVLADHLDEMGDARADRVRWWRAVRPKVLGAVEWSVTRQVEWDGDVGPRIDRLANTSQWLSRLYAIEVLRASLARYPLPKFKGRAEVLRVIGRTLAVAECHAFGLATDEELSAAESAAGSAARSAAWSATWSAARSAAGSAARSAAWSATWSAAWSATWSAAWSATWSAARSAAWSATWSAARSAARSAAEQMLAAVEAVEQSAPNGNSHDAN